MTVLLMGNVNKISENAMIKAFPDEEIIVLRKEIKKRRSRQIKSITLTESTDLNLLIDTYQADFVIYFSEFLTPELDGKEEFQQLEAVLDVLKNKKCHFIYVEGPYLNFSHVSNKGLLAAAAEQLCLSYRDSYGLTMKILRSLFLYDANTICYLLDSENNTVNWDQKAFLIYQGDLLALLYRMVDNWKIEDSGTIYSIPDEFSVSYHQIAESLEMSKESQEKLFTDDAAIIELNHSDKLLSKTYRWFPKISPLEDISSLEMSSKKGSEQIKEWHRLVSVFRADTIWSKFLIVLVFFAVSEVLTHVLGQQVYFNMIDYRLLFVVVSGLLLGAKFGLLAAFLSSLSLVYNTMTVSNISFSAIFFEPSNWIAYIAMFIAGAVSGIVKDQGKDSQYNLVEQNKLLAQKLSDEHQFIDDLLEKQSELTYQLIGRTDSYGQIDFYMKKLDTPYLDIFLARMVQMTSELFATDAIYLYSRNDAGQFKLELSKSTKKVESLQNIQHLTSVMTDLSQTKTWINHRLEKGYPMFVASLTGQNIQLYLVVDQVANNKLDLYHQNLFLVLTDIFQLLYRYCLLQQNHATVAGQQVYNISDFQKKLELLSQEASGDLHYQLAEIEISADYDFTSIVTYLLQHISQLDSLSLIDGKLYLLNIFVSETHKVSLENLLANLPVKIKSVSDLSDLLASLEIKKNVS